jgi:hypothetical protein
MPSSRTLKQNMGVARVSLSPENLCGIFTAQNISQVRWTANASAAKAFKEQSAGVVWRDLPRTLQCGKPQKNITRVVKDGSQFGRYALVKYPEGTIGVGSDMIYVAIEARNSRWPTQSVGVCTFDGTENKWFQTTRIAKDCIRM